MSENKFIAKLKGEPTPKSVVEIQNDRLVAPFKSSPMGHIADRDSSVVVAKGAQNWAVNQGQLVPVADDYIGTESDLSGTSRVSGAGLWLNATYTFPATGDETNPVSAIIAPSAKWVLTLCGDSLITQNGSVITLTMLVKIGATHLTTKQFKIRECASQFSQRLAIDFSESEQKVIKAHGGSPLTVQVLCDDEGASATIYSGMTHLTLLQRKIDAELVATDNVLLPEFIENLLEGYIIPADYFSRYDYIEQVEDGGKAMPEFTRNGDDMTFSGWAKPATEVYSKTEIDDKFTVANAQIDANADAIQKTRDDMNEEDGRLQTQITAQAGAIAGKQDKLTAGENITIEDGVISATGGGSQADLTDYVKNTDYASMTKAGLIKLSAGNALTISKLDGSLYAYKLALGEYQNSADLAFVGKGTLENIKDDYVKRGITANAITLTDEEKAAAQAWLGVESGGDYLPLSGGTLTGPLGIGKATFRQQYNDLYLDFENTKGVFTFNCGGGRINPLNDGFGGLGSSNARWGVVCTKTLYNGADIAIPTEGGTLARLEDLEGLGGGDSLPDQTDNAGKFLTTDGTTASWGAALTNNTTAGLAIAVGENTEAQLGGIAVGYAAKAYGWYGVAIGEMAVAQSSSIAIGDSAKATQNRAIQIGRGTNSDANTFKVANDNGNFEMMSADGTIPAARHATLPTEDGTYVLKCVMSGGVPTVDYSDTEFIAHQAMPSGTYEEWDLGATGTNHTAPADGYFVFTKTTDAVNQYVAVASGAMRQICFCPVAGFRASVVFPCYKGQSINIAYTAGGTTSAFGFVYANGAK